MLSTFTFLSDRLIHHKLINIFPALQQRPSDVIHPGFRPMVQIVDIPHHIFCVPPIRRSEWLIPLREDE